MSFINITGTKAFRRREKEIKMKAKIALMIVAISAVVMPCIAVDDLYTHEWQ